MEVRESVTSALAPTGSMALEDAPESALNLGNVSPNRTSVQS